MSKYVMAIDSGTTSNRCILFNKQSEICALAQKEFKQIYPFVGWVEHDANEIWDNVLSLIEELLDKNNINVEDISSIGITNQRETTIVWDKITGKPIYNAICWQCKRTSAYCDQLNDKGYSNMIQSKTGLKIDSYFSGTKLKWILDNVPNAKDRAKNGELLFGTVDSFLIWKLTGGKVHATDYSNASRTLLYNIVDLCWDKEILDLFNIPEVMLPKVLPSSGFFGETDPKYFEKQLKITGVAGDQQAALFGQTCFEKGDTKNTYGTGCFMLMNTGEEIIRSNNGLLTTIAWGLDGKVKYALEGSIFIAGAAVKWLRDEMQLIKTSEETYEYAIKVKDTNGCYFVPAFVGLGAPYWDQHARGAIVGLTRGVNKNHIIRATLESICYQTYDVLKIMQEESKLPITTLKVDGGASVNDFIMQFQSDIIDSIVIRPSCVESTALGAAYLAGLATGFFKSKEDINKIKKTSKVFYPNISYAERTMFLSGWEKAVKTVMKSE